MSIDQTLLAASKLAADRLKLPQRFILAWFISENGWKIPSTFNFGNISYQGEGVPSGGVFEGVERVDPNRVCEYKDWESGVNAFVLLVETPKHDKHLTVDLSDLHACGDDVHKMCVLVGESNWAASHYDTGGEGAGSLIWNVYNSPVMVETFGHATPSEAPARPTVKTTPKIVRHTYVIRKGDTLSRIALHVRVPLRVLQALNSIENADKIAEGDTLELPNVYVVKPGDTVTKIAAKEGSTVSAIAKMNAINPDKIDVGWKLYV